MAKATLLMTGEFLRQLLNLPVDTFIDGSDKSEDHAHLGRADYVAIRVEHPDIPEGTTIVSPEYRKQPEVVFLGWGAKP